MSLIHDVILDEVEAILRAALIDDIDPDDVALAGVVKQGFLQGNPDPDQARISVELFENDPHAFYGSGETSGMEGSWEDEIIELECGGSVTWARRFTALARVLLVNTQEEEDEARQIASTVRSRMEKALLNASLQGIVDSDGEFVSKGALSDKIKAEMVQSGGPGAYDYYIKIRFQVETTTGVTP